MLAERGALPRRVFRDLEGSLFGVTANGVELSLVGPGSHTSESESSEENNNGRAIDESPQVITMRNGLRVGIGATSRVSIPRKFPPSAEATLIRQNSPGYWTKENKKA